MANPESPKDKPTGYSDDINFKRVVKEAAAAMDHEEKYLRENDAKFRAVYQKVETYEQFRDIVLASNLRPLEKTDTLSVKLKDTWNMNATKSEVDTLKRTREQQQTKTQFNILPSGKIELNSQSEFYQIYRSFSLIEKYQFLLRIGGEQILGLFPTEIEVFDDIMCVLSQGFRTSDVNAIIQLMANLSCMKRFSLSLLFMEKSTKLNVDSLIKRITDSNQSPIEELEKVFSKYS